jgi:predicted nuclease of predicted toxin-antitoxin system
MKFLVDAHLPRRSARWLQENGYDAIHTLDLPNKNYTSDAEINAISIQDKRIVITKDADFVNSFLLMKQPYKLLLISTGNIQNSELESLFLSNILVIDKAFEVFNYIELSRTNIIFHQ